MGLKKSINIYAQSGSLTAVRSDESNQRANQALPIARRIKRTIDELAIAAVEKNYWKAIHRRFRSEWSLG